MRHIPWTATVLFLFSSLCYPQDAPPTDSATIGELVQQVKDLQARVKLLESQQNHTVAAAVTPSNQPMPPAEPTDQTTPAPTVAQEPHEVHGIQWRGFGEADYKVLNQRAPELGTYGFVPGSQGNFYNGDFGLFLTSRLTSKPSVLAEIVFEESDAQK